jgi:short-subunit dehydrogenase
MAINLRAPAIVSQIIAKEMIANSIRGSIVHISSQASVRPLLDHTAYCNYYGCQFQINVHV